MVAKGDACSVAAMVECNQMMGRDSGTKFVQFWLPRFVWKVEQKSDTVVGVGLAVGLEMFGGSLILK